MRLFIYLFLYLTGSACSSVISERSQLNSPCTGKDGKPGVCVSTSSCSKAGGAYINNACPGTPNDIKCCTKTSCGKSGNCRWTNQCSATTSATLAGLCPGPTSFKCCQPKIKDAGKKILEKAKTAKGINYVWGGGSCNGPTGKGSGGYDCSGLVSWAVCAVTGRNLFAEELRVTWAMYCATPAKLQYQKIAFSKRQIGDAVFFGGACDCTKNKEGIHHVGLMMDSGTKMWNALKSGTQVREDDFGKWGEKPCPYVIRFH